MPPDAGALWPRARAAARPGAVLADAHERVPLTDLDRRSLLGPALPALAGANVLIWSTRQLPAARALLELDGVAGRLLLCPPDAAPEHLPALLAEAEVDAIVAADPPPWPAGAARLVPLAEQAPAAVARGRPTEWVLFTSGTTGRPKLVAHTLASLAGPLAEGPVGGDGARWSTFYDIRRYGGLQILLRALHGGTSLILSDAAEPPAATLARLAREGVTHLLGTPTHWRRALMSPAIAHIAPRYVRLSGEIADQAILDQLARAFPAAAIVHAYASTEAGVGFEVTDGRAGFPPSVLGPRPDGRELRIVDGSIRIRSPRAASRYLGSAPENAPENAPESAPQSAPHDSRAQALAGPDGFIDTGDMVLERGGRFYFAGRRSGVINVGGQKVHPEEVEAVLVRHPAVRFARVHGRRSPITGTLVAADVTLAPGADFGATRAELLAACRAVLPPYKVPATLTEVVELGISGAGKLDRTDA